ncbi:reverse transcriptase domain-containing protein [Tanacetum coccineum]|uniref:Reverse transcriptase domain-containing protein n=1 Tax=Tanacetum coccineum TaxID=301880 RepID=A0ABQ5A1A5_9ASTR
MHEQLGVGEFSHPYYISQLCNPLIISRSFNFGDLRIIYAWALEVDGGYVSSYKMLFSIPYPLNHELKLLGFNKDKEPIAEANDMHNIPHWLQVFNPIVESFQNVGVEANGVEMVVKKFNLDPNDWLNLSVKLPSLHLDITDNEDVKFFVDCASSSTNDGIPYLYVAQPRRTQPRIIPGPVGILQAAMLRKNADIIEVGHENVMPTQEYVRKIIEDNSEDDHFTCGPWLNAIVCLHGEGVMASGCLGDMKKYCKNGKLEMVVGVVMSSTPNSLGDMTVTLKDPTCIMGGTIHYKVFEKEDGYTKSIKVGYVLILRNVFMFTPKPSNHYLNITIRNVVKVFENDTIF